MASGLDLKQLSFSVIVTCSLHVWLFILFQPHTFPSNGYRGLLPIGVVFEYTKRLKYLRSGDYPSTFFTFLATWTICENVDRVISKQRREG